MPGQSRCSPVSAGVGAVQAAVGSVAVALVVRVGEGAAHQPSEKTTTGHAALALEHSLVTRRQTTQPPVVHVTNTELLQPSVSTY